MNSNSTCAIYAVTGKYGTQHFTDTLTRAKKLIDKLIMDGITTFVTAGKSGYELECLRYLENIALSNPKIEVVIVLSSKNQKVSYKIKPIFDRLLFYASKVIYIDDYYNDDLSKNRDRWILSNCDNLLCVRSNVRNKLIRLSNKDISNKSIFEVFEVEEEQNINVEKSNINVEKSKRTEDGSTFYPNNLLKEIFGDEQEQINDLLKLNDLDNRLLKACENLLKERDFVILKQRFVDRYTLEKIGRGFNLSRERIRQILKRSSRKLKCKSYKEKIFKYLMYELDDSFLTTLSNPDCKERTKYLMPELDDSFCKILSNPDYKGSMAGERWTAYEEEMLKKEVFDFVDWYSATYKIKPCDLYEKINKLCLFKGNSMKEKGKLEEPKNSIVDKEDEEIKKEFEKLIEKISSLHRRTPGAIRARIKKMNLLK